MNLVRVPLSSEERRHTGGPSSGRPGSGGRSPTCGSRQRTEGGLLSAPSLGASWEECPPPSPGRDGRGEGKEVRREGGTKGAS